MGQGALAERYATVTAQGARICGTAGGIFADALIANERGLATVFVAFAGDIRRTGRLTELVVPAAELVTVVHAGSYYDFDLAYGALATHVAQHAISVDEPIREYFLVGPQDTRDETAWRTELGGQSFTPPSPKLAHAPSTLQRRLLIPYTRCHAGLAATSEKPTKSAFHAADPATTSSGLPLDRTISCSAFRSACWMMSRSCANVAEPPVTLRFLNLKPQIVTDLVEPARLRRINLAEVAADALLTELTGPTAWRGAA